jgi:uncharacterized protein (TIGR02001 family)
MRRSLLALLVSLAWAALLPGAVSGQVDLVSRYIWRGFDLLPGNHPAIQPQFSIDLGRSGFSLGVWSSFALERRDEFASADEIDVTISYEVPLPADWEMIVGLTNYGYWFADGFKFRDHTSREIFIQVAGTGMPLSPTITVNYDFNLGSGLYVTLGGSHELKLSERISMEMGGLIGFNSRQYIDKTGFSDVDIYARLPLTLGRLTLTPSLNAMIPLLDEVNEETEIWFGLSAAI